MAAAIALEACRAADAHSKPAKLRCPVTHASSLCTTLRKLQSLPCEALLELQRMERLIEMTGLAHVGAARSKQMYGEHGSRFMSARAGEGLVQHPRQLARALLHLATLGLDSYLELGIATSWTLAFLTGYLSRFRRSPRFYATGVDITFRLVTTNTSHILSQLGVLLRQRRGAWANERYGFPSGRIGLCLIDANHVYRHVLADYRELAPHCAHVMLHDIADFDCWRNAAGGPPLLWSQLKANLRRGRWVEFVDQPDIYPPTFGLGLVLPHATKGTGEVDHDWARNGSRPLSAPAHLIRAGRFCGDGMRR
jgi:hypothetical protein